MERIGRAAVVRSAGRLSRARRRFHVKHGVTAVACRQAPQQTRATLPLSQVAFAGTFLAVMGRVAFTRAARSGFALFHVKRARIPDGRRVSQRRTSLRYGVIDVVIRRPNRSPDRPMGSQV